MAAGSAMSPNGQESLLKMEITNHTIEPRIKTQTQVIIYTLVFLEVSNLRMYDMRAPGQIRAVTGSHAHFWLQTLLIVGNCSQNGLLKILRMAVLQLALILKVRISTKTNSTQIVALKQINACFSEVNFSTLMAATIMETAITSFTTQLLFESCHPIHTPILITMLNKSSTLIPKLLIRNTYFLSISNSNQLVQSQTAASPKTHDNMQTAIFTTWNLKIPTIPPITKRELKAIITGKLISHPAPPIDHALEYSATTVMRMVHKNTSRKSPYSQVLPWNELQHNTQQDTLTSREEIVRLMISKQLQQFSFCSQLFTICSKQGQAAQLTCLLSFINGVI